MKLKMTATALVAGSLLGVAAYSATSQPSQVQAKASYRVQITKNAYVYTSKGKKTKTVYKKHKVLTAYRIRKIRGKYYYDLGHGKYVRTSYAKKYYYRTYKQSKKITRTIKLYQPKGKKYVYQNAYVKRTVKQNTRTGRKTYGKWGTSSWGVYTAPAVKGYSASPKSVASETVYSWTKNKTVKIKYKKNAKKRTSKPTTPAKQNNSSANQSSSSSMQSNTSKQTSTNNSTSTSSNNSESSSSPAKNNASSSTSNNDTSNTETPKFNPWNAKKEEQAIQGCVQVINDFRKQAGKQPLTLDPQFQSILTKRAESKAKDYWNTLDCDHSGWMELDKQMETIDPTIVSSTEDEELSAFYVDAYTSDQEQINTVINTLRKGYQVEKEDYEAMVVNHTRTKIQNQFGTFGHYTSIILDKPETGVNMDTPQAEFCDLPHTHVSIGIAPYSATPTVGNYAMSIVIEAVQKK